jgi:hypothetical protein
MAYSILDWHLFPWQNCFENQRFYTKYNNKYYNGIYILNISVFFLSWHVKYILLFYIVFFFFFLNHGQTSWKHINVENEKANSNRKEKEKIWNIASFFTFGW